MAVGTMEGKRFSWPNCEAVFMSSEKSKDRSNGANNGNFQEIMSAIDSRNWAELDRLVGMSPEEAERILREEPMIDGDEFMRMWKEADRIAIPMFE